MNRTYQSHVGQISQVKISIQQNQFGKKNERKKKLMRWGDLTPTKPVKNVTKSVRKQSADEIERKKQSEKGQKYMYLLIIKWSWLTIQMKRVVF